MNKLKCFFGIHKYTFGYLFGLHQFPFKKCDRCKICFQEIAGNRWVVCDRTAGPLSHNQIGEK